MTEVRDVLREVRLTVGSEGDNGERERQQARVKRMLISMGVSEDDLDSELREHKQQQEAAAAAVPDSLHSNGDAQVGLAGEVLGMDAIRAVQDNGDEMDIEGTADVDMVDNYALPGIACF